MAYSSLLIWLVAPLLWGAAEFAYLALGCLCAQPDPATEKGAQRS